MKDNEKSFVIHGIMNIVIHLPVLIATSLWVLLMIGIFDLNSITDPFWYAVTMFPLLIPPVSCIIGIIRGSLGFKKHKSARVCLILSVIGLFLYIGIMILCVRLGSIA